MKKKTALITGIKGQDGAYLARLLLKKGYKVYGADNAPSATSNWRLKEVGIEKKVKTVAMDLLDLASVRKAIRRTKPDEVYNFASRSFMPAGLKNPVLTAKVNGSGVVRLLKALRLERPGAKFFQASTCEMFGTAHKTPQSETARLRPAGPYATAKAYGHRITVNYREHYGLFACSGILFSHESPLRGEEFLTRKVTRGVAAIKLGLQNKIIVGNVAARRDWGFAGEYVDGMWRMLQQEKAGDYVLATGKSHSVKEFIERAFERAGYRLKWMGKGAGLKALDRKTGRILVEVSPALYRRLKVDSLLGDPGKAARVLGWKPKTKFRGLVNMMVDAEIKRLRGGV